MRRFDEAAKVPGAKVPKIEYYVDFMKKDIRSGWK